MEPNIEPGTRNRGNGVNQGQYPETFDQTIHRQEKPGRAHAGCVHRRGRRPAGRTRTRPPEPDVRRPQEDRTGTQHEASARTRRRRCQPTDRTPGATRMETDRKVPGPGENKEGWMMFAHSGPLELRALRPEDIHLGDIVHALGRINRFLGQTRRPISVLQAQPDRHRAVPAGAGRDAPRGAAARRRRSVRRRLDQPALRDSRRAHPGAEGARPGDRVRRRRAQRQERRAVEAGAGGRPEPPAATAGRCRGTSR